MFLIMRLTKERVGVKLRLMKYYELEKDNAFPNATYFRNKMKRDYGLEDRDCSELYAMVVKHQIEKYGQNLSRAFSVKGKDKRSDSTYKKRIHRR